MIINIININVYLIVSREMLEFGEDVATCPSCSLIVRVIYDPEEFIKMETLSISTPAKLADPT